MLILGALVLLAQAETRAIRQPPGGGGGASPSRPCQPVHISAPQLLDLKLSTQLRRYLAGPHTLQIKVSTPRGYPYQTLSVSFSDTPQESRPHPQALSATLPVAGTAITTNSLYGRWTVQPFLDGVPCGGLRSFVLHQ